MNRFILNGVIRTIKYLPDSILVYVDDMERGYKRGDGVHVDDLYYTWKVVFSNHFKVFITKYFNEGMLVDIDARMRPYAVEKKETTQGYSCIGLSIQRSCYVKPTAKAEQRMIKESQGMVAETPDLDAFNEPDF